MTNAIIELKHLKKYYEKLIEKKQKELDLLSQKSEIDVKKEKELKDLFDGEFEAEARYDRLYDR